MDILQMLYDSEINFELSTFWDDGFRWKLGDNWNGFKADGHADNLAEAIEQLKDAAFKHFPSSEFAQKIRAQA
jgi:hypothetical protein